jgi:hypothetical protein
MSVSNLLLELVNKQMEHITKIIGSGSEWQPELLMVKREAVAVLVFSDIPMLMDTAAFIVRLLRPDAYCFAAEGWATTPEPGPYRRGDIEKSEAKFEILMQVWCVNGGQQNFRIFTIDRVNNKLDPFETGFPQEELEFETKLPSSW